jgi:hypothetical protein
LLLHESVVALPESSGRRLSGRYSRGATRSNRTIRAVLDEITGRPVVSWLISC